MERPIKSQEFFVGAVTGFCLLVSASLAAAKTPSGYGVTQTGNLVFIRTPFGSSVYLAPVGFDSIRSYAFEIPLTDFRTNLTGGNGRGQEGSGGTSGGDGTAKTTVGDVSTLIVEANRLYGEGDFARALKYVDEVHRRDPANVRAWVMKGSLMHVMGHKDLARQAWSRAHEIDPKNTQLQNILKEMK